MVAMDISLSLNSGQALGVIGPSGSGKSSLARLLVGVWQPMRGNVRLDGAALDQWSSEQRGRHIGYLPQDVELFSGTVAQNIGRFDSTADLDAIIRAAKAAGAHDLIVSLPNGYQTEIGEDGAALSAGQRQRIGLARALFGDPFLVVLDEPNSNLEFEGETALTEAILRVKARGGIVVVVAHRPAALGAVDLVMVLQQGRVLALGPRNDVLSNTRRAARKRPGCRLVRYCGPFPKGASRHDRASSYQHRRIAATAHEARARRCRTGPRRRRRVGCHHRDLGRRRDHGQHRGRFERKEVQHPPGAS